MLERKPFTQTLIFILFIGTGWLIFSNLKPETPKTPTPQATATPASIRQLIEGYAGLPAVGKTGDKETRLVQILLAQDLSKTLVVFVISQPRPSEPGKLDEARDEYLCILANRSCVPSDLLKRADLKVAPAFVDPSTKMEWLTWDVAQGTFLGRSPVTEGGRQTYYLYSTNAETWREL